MDLKSIQLLADLLNLSFKYSYSAQHKIGMFA